MARLYGRLYDPDTGAGLSNIAVRVNGYMDVSDDDGNYAVEVSQGTYTVTIRAEIRQPITERLNITVDVRRDYALRKLVPI